MQNASGTDSPILGNYGAEFAQFWVHLGLSGTISKQYDASNTSEDGFPLLKSNMIAIMAATCLYQSSKKCYQMRYGRLTSMPNLDSMDATHSFTPELAFQFDTKLDDGNASSGRFQAKEETGDICHIDGSYVLSAVADTCRPELVMGVQ